MKEADMWKYSTCLLFSCHKDNNKYQRSLFHTVIYPTPQVYRQGIRGQPPLTRWVFVTRKTYLAYYVTLLCYRNFQSRGIRYNKKRKSDYHSKTNKKNYTRGGMCMGRPKSRQAPRTTMSIRVSERERRQIEEKAMATGLAASAYIRTMALDDGNVDTTIHEDRQKLMHELSAIGNHINQIARMANTNLFILKSDVQDVKEQLRQIQRLLMQYIRSK